MSLRFGTDGVRGVAGSELTPELVLALGRAAARVLCPTRPGDGGRPHLVVARDTRRSGPMLESAFAAGAVAEGVDVVHLGVLPTPGLAHVAAAEGVPAAMVSASHNPFADNGIKLFGPGGRKLESETERALEAVLDEVRGGPDRGPHLSGADIGTITTREAPGAAYVDALVSSFPPGAVDGIVVVQSPVVPLPPGAVTSAAPVP